MGESITVSMLNKHTRFLIEHDEVLSQVWVEGEISGYSVHYKTGHAYFTLRDSEASVRAVMFCEYASRLRFVPKDGMYIVANCKVSFYERDGQFQLYVYDIMPKGRGAIQQQAEQAKAKLESEGLFAAERKRPIPRNAKNIGVITSAGSAALQDIYSVISRRNPMVKVTVYSTNVQGTAAVNGIIKAIGMVNRNDDVELVIIARGGGSAEDLWYFNDEELVRAAAALRVPFISAVGHETDTTLIDYVSDMRAATPSVAAEIAVYNLTDRYSACIDEYENAKVKILQRLEIFTNSIRIKKSRLADAANRALAVRQHRVDNLESVCRALDPKNVLVRGYARVTKNKTGVSSASKLEPGDDIVIEFSDGAVGCVVKEKQ